MKTSMEGTVDKSEMRMEDETLKIFLRGGQAFLKARYHVEDWNMECRGSISRDGGKTGNS